MSCKRLILILLTFIPFIMNAQYDIKSEKISTWMFQATYAYQFPGKDTKVLYGDNHSIGGSLFYIG